MVPACEGRLGMLAFPQKLPTQGVCSLNPTSHKTDGVASVPTNHQLSWTKTAESCATATQLTGSD